MPHVTLAKDLRWTLPSPQGHGDRMTTSPWSVFGGLCENRGPAAPDHGDASRGSGRFRTDRELASESWRRSQLGAPGVRRLRLATDSVASPLYLCSGVLRRH